PAKVGLVPELPDVTVYVERLAALTVGQPLEGMRIASPFVLRTVSPSPRDLVGIASYSARGKQYVVCLRPYQNGLILHQLRYAQEVKDWAEVPMPSLPELKPQELGLAKQIIQQIAHETFSPEKYKDEVQERMMQLINQKIEGQEITVAPEAPTGKVIDLMEALKASLGMTQAEDRKGAKAAEEKEEAAPKKKAASKKK
ncbi:MAG TPA: Ku protein, partial [Kofleriaceae bacterium]|nr:Ku protein [Kofleriaceae bacterium]